MLRCDSVVACVYNTNRLKRLLMTGCMYICWEAPARQCKRSVWCERERVCVCVWERERKLVCESVSVCVRERENLYCHECVCLRDKAYVWICVYECVWGRGSVYMWECVIMSVCVCVCVCEREGTSTYVYVRGKVCLCVCIRGSLYMNVWERKLVCESVNVCVSLIWVCEGEWVCMCVVRERGARMANLWLCIPQPCACMSLVYAVFIMNGCVRVFTDSFLSMAYLTVYMYMYITL